MSDCACQINDKGQLTEICGAHSQWMRLERDLAIAEEREACAKVCDDRIEIYTTKREGFPPRLINECDLKADATLQCAIAIRQRSKEDK